MSDKRSFLPLVEIVKFEHLIQMGDFETAKDYWNSLSTKDKLSVAVEIKQLRTGTRYTSQGKNVLDTIAIFACILGTENGRLFFLGTPLESNAGNIPEYEIFLQKILGEIRQFFAENSNDKDHLELLLLQATQIIGLSMDRLFFFVNKPESTEFVLYTKNQLKKWLGKFRDILTRNVVFTNQELNRVMEDAIASTRILRSIIAINFIAHDPGVNEVKRNTVTRALDILNLDEEKASYYQHIGEANLELALAKNAVTSGEGSQESLDAIALLRERFKIYCGEGSGVSLSVLGLELPSDPQELTDDALEVLATLLSFRTIYGTKELVAFFHYILGESECWNYYSNERQQGFSLVTIEKVLEILTINSKDLSVNQVSILARKLLQYIEKCPSGQLLQEDLSRIFLRISNFCGSGCLNQLNFSEKGTQRSSYAAQNYTLLITGLNALTRGIRIFHEEERVRNFSPLFLEAIFFEYILKNKYYNESILKSEERVERGYNILHDSWLGRPSHIECLQNQQIEWVAGRIQKINLPENISYLGVSLREICETLSETYHGFYKFEIHAYEKNVGYLGDISVQTVALTLGYELRIHSPLGKFNEINALANSNEIQFICKEITRFIQTSIHIFCGAEYMSVIHRFENEIPHESPNSIAQWYRRIVEKQVSPMLYVQQKAALVASEAGSKLPYEVVGGGVECLLRFYEPQKDMTFGPGAYPNGKDGKCDHEFGVLEAMNALGIYTSFMHEHLKSIFEQMSRIDVPFSLNVRGDELGSSSYMAHMDTLCNEYNIKPERITIEILEEGLNLKNPQVVLTIQNFLQRGMRISVDDFGSNQSGEVRINGIREIISRAGIANGKFEIKLDAIYAEQLITNFEYVKGLVGILKLSGASICCEYIESDIHIEKAFLAGIDTIQGYAHHKPEPVNAFISNQKKKQLQYTTPPILTLELPTA